MFVNTSPLTYLRETAVWAKVSLRTENIWSRGCKTCEDFEGIVMTSTSLALADAMKLAERCALWASKIKRLGLCAGLFGTKISLNHSTKRSEFTCL